MRAIDSTSRSSTTLLVMIMRAGPMRIARPIWSGAIIATLPTEELDLLFLNKQTDRIYIGTKRGLVQCLREPRNEFPLLHQDEAAKADEAAKPKAPDAVKDGENPFGAEPKKDDKKGDNPFGL